MGIEVGDKKKTAERMVGNIFLMLDEHEHSIPRLKKKLANHKHDILKLVDKVEQLEQMIINLSYKLKFQRGEKSEEGRTNQRQG